MPIVKMPDGTSVSFPDEMPKEQIAGMIAKKFPDAAPKQRGYFEGLANAGGEAISNRGIGLFQTAQDAGIPMHKVFGAIVGREISPEEFNAAAQKAVKLNEESAKGTGVSGAIVGGLADPLNLLPFGKLGVAALPTYGAVSGFTRGESSPENIGGRAENAAIEGLLTTIAGKATEKTLGKMASSVLPKQPIPKSMEENLINQSPDVKTYAGEQLQEMISAAEKQAREAKNAAYQLAGPAAKKLKVNTAKVLHGGAGEIPEQVASLGNITTDLGNSVRSAVEHFDTQVVKNKSVIGKIMNDFEKESSKGPVSWDRIDLIRKRLYALPKANDAEAAARSAALSSFHNYANNLLEKGLVEGDATAIKLVKDANSKNAYWRKNFTGDEANKVISNFIDSNGGVEQIAPENLLDQFVNVGKAGYQNVSALKSVLGNKAKPILQAGFYNKLRQQSLEADGSINPAKMSKSIRTFLQNNKTLSESIFSPDELASFKKVANVADTYAKNRVMKETVKQKLTSAIPLFGPVIREALSNKQYNKMIGEMVGGRPQVNVPFMPFNYGTAASE